ncbi:MAG: thioredoxin domain-containing protein [Clostridiales bacterium]|nr:thioredoxin domain-containing protein [Clostridiales bacterium]MCF8021254.1 thioredoxin domain-containing protein [Clostridiales bacterium]
MSTEHKIRSNQLIHEKSPYLLQHAYNPVDWYPWSEKAFEKAESKDKPIFLSIGYSTCHWCHVMERESFEDADVAKILNDNFISIKVDREERPDIDQVYMTVCQALTGHGGWPLSIFMTPDKNPFFAGTYFPRDAKWGHAGLQDILSKISEKWNEDRNKLYQAGENIVEQISPHLSTNTSGEVSENILLDAYKDFQESFDPHYGGFGGAPKFPAPHNLFFLLRHYKHTSEKNALHMVEKTLQSMHRGGIFDHIGFGFSRYSTDEKWLVPHFEKMLYDNALLSIAYLECYQVTGKDVYALAAREIFTYVLRDMTSHGGAFYSAEDADSEGEEGKFYVWTPEEIIEILGQEKGDMFCQIYDITGEGNFEGKNIPNLIKTTPEEKAKEWNVNENELRGSIEECRIKLFKEREKREYPYKDDKILTAWNGLMIASLARGASILEEDRYANAAFGAADFIWKNMRKNDGRLLARYREGEAAFNAYLEDYAFLTWGMLELYETTLEPVHLSRAVTLTEQMIDLFYDRENGGFFLYGKDAEKLFARPKEAFDGAFPSGNSVAALNLLRIARLTGDSHLDDIAEQQIKAFAGNIKDNPRAYSYFLTAIQFALYPSREIVIAGSTQDNQVNKMISSVHRQFTPNTLLILHQEGKNKDKIEKLIPFVKEQKPVDGKATAYICQNFTCHAPVTEAGALEKELQ